jgi:inhibitor of KinA sporulation pathway (predicted exonuclease)
MPRASNRDMRILQNNLVMLRQATMDEETAEAMLRAKSSTFVADTGTAGPSPPLPASTAAAVAAVTIPEEARVNRFGKLATGEKTQGSAAGQIKRSGGSPEPQGAKGDETKGKPSKRCCRDFDILFVIDFEATCDESAHDWPNEIIEFPVVALDTQTCRVVAEFHSYVRPVRNPTLTDFCTRLTGISQESVNAAPDLQTVVRQFEAWQRATFPEAVRCMVATDGPWDMRDFMFRHSVLRDGVVFPPLFYSWVNLRKEYATFFKIKPIGVGQMLTRLGLTFEGRQHSGIDDARNIARIAATLIGRGCRLNHVSSIEVDGADAKYAAMARAIEDCAL